MTSLRLAKERSTSESSSPRGQTIGTGQANVKAYNRQLRDLIHQGKAAPSMLVSHNLGLADAPDAYRHFDARDKGWTKVVLNPAKG